MFKYLRFQIRIAIAFTLAEVLITLTIIGVIAALTIPVLLQNIQDAQLRTAWKSVYSMVEQANKRALMDNGGDFTNVFQNWTDMKDKMKSYFSYTKECAAGQSEGNCWPAQYYFMNGSSATVTDIPALVLNNGMFIRFYMTTNGTTCSETNYYNAPSECGMYEVDVNGFKGPNTFGKDLFFIHVLSNKIEPAGAPGSIYLCNFRGYGCGFYYLMQ